MLRIYQLMLKKAMSFFCILYVDRDFSAERLTNSTAKKSKEIKNQYLKIYFASAHLHFMGKVWK
jgi:hypothetical protein